MKIVPVLLICLLILNASCSNSTSNDQNNNDGQKVTQASQKTEVDTIVLTHSSFTRELVSNGKLHANRKAVLKFLTGGLLESVHATNGQYVQKGAIIARLDKQEFQAAFVRAKSQLERSWLELNDILLGQGFSAEDTAAIPEDILEIAKVRSGYKSALASLQEARFNLNNTMLKAPFYGIIANIKYKTHEQINTGTPFCTLMDVQNIEVEFSILETEMEDVKLNRPVTIKPLAGGSYTGNISEINPVVNENGLIKVKARVPNPNGSLMEGMNVKVLVQNPVSNQLVIPKSALVLRQNKEVVFTVSNDSIAMWNYVQTGMENSRSYTVMDGLRRGDTVIISGNINLAHESKVSIN